MAEGTELLAYDEARRAVAAALAFDEVLGVRDKAEAVRVYARLAGDRTMEVDACEIRLRAERRLGLLMADHRAAGLLRPGPDGQDAAGRVNLVDADIKGQLANRARRYAELAEEEWEQRLLSRRAAILADAATRISVNLLDAADVTAAKAQRRAQREAELGARQQALPEKRYGVVLDDPEWRFEVRSRETGLDRAADNHYPTSDLAAIAARDIGAIAAADCAWFRWVTVPFLAHGIRLMEQVAGFTYRTCWVWAKDRVGTGYWNRNRHEILLLAVRGQVPCPAPGTQWDSLLEADVGEHSAKPECFLAMIEAYFPTLPKIELNRRGPGRPGWDAWGNEAVMAELEAVA